ncbi:LuxR C-terminal-related transcriptional regulator [Salinibacterium amurskyense]|uniref:LuxR C-terminal-related transcriptional regulator n=1 Tax=Salinibacterium amurskyense TaxID=205941 RepID=UPI00311F4F21
MADETGENAVRRIRDSGVPLVPHGFVERSRLTYVLDSAKDASLIVVRGSGGSGKSGLVTSWLRGRRTNAETNKRHLWVSLDDGARSRGSFWRRIVRAFHTFGAITDDSPLSNSILGYADLDDIPGLVLAQLDHDRVLTRLVLDDFHLVDDSNAADVIWLLKQSRWLRVIVTTRRPGSLEAPDVAARLHSLVITEEALAFTAEETRDLLSSTTRFSADHALVVHSATNGHPLATRIAVTLLLQRPETVVAPVADAANLTRQLAEHISHTLLPAFADDKHRLFAAAVSIPPELPVSLASQLGDHGIEDATRILNDFAAEGLGEFRHGDDELVFRFHPLVSEALRRHAERALTAETLNILRLQSARHLSARGNGLEALKLFIAAEDFERIWPTVSQHFSELINYQQDELHSLLTTIPLDVLLQHGTAAISLAIVMSEREATPSSRLRQLVEHGIRDIDSRAKPTNPTQSLLLSLARFAGFRAARRYESAALEGDAFVAFAESLPADASASIRHAIGAGLIQIVITNILLGRWDHATKIAHLISVDDHAGRAQHRASLLAYIYAMSGRMPESLAHLRDVTHMDRPGWKTSVPATGWHIATAFQLFEKGSPEAALEALSTITARLSRIEHWPYVVWLTARLRLASGEPQLALDGFNAAVALNEFRPLSDYARALLQSMKADLHLALGQPALARRELDSAHSHRDSCATILAEARYALATDDAAGASEVLDLDLIQTTGTQRDFAEALMLSAALKASVSRDDEALALLARGTQVMKQSHTTSPVVMVPQTELRTLSADRAPELAELFAGTATPFAHIARVNPLTPREREVLTALSQRSSLDDVASELFVSVNTVKSQLRSVYRKLGVSSGSEAVRTAQKNGFIQV